MSDVFSLKDDNLIICFPFFFQRGTPTISRTPKDSIGAPPVEGLYDSKYIAPSPLSERKQVFISFSNCFLQCWNSYLLLS